MNPYPFPNPGAIESPFDPRTIKHEDVAAAGTPSVSGGRQYDPADIDHQHHVGICTAISLTQNRQKANGRKYSPDFQYLLQKKFFDLDWYEGSSIFHALKVGKNFGFLPIEQFPYVSEQDRLLPYDQYIAKLQAIPDAEVERLKTLCVDKIPGYAAVNVNDSQAIAKAIEDSEAGILCRYGCGDTWWTGVNGNISWNPADINPLRQPHPATSGHAIGMISFDYRTAPMQRLANTWGVDWDEQGQADINYRDYPMAEAWSILRATPVIPPAPSQASYEQAVATLRKYLRPGIILNMALASLRHFYGK